MTAELNVVHVNGTYILPECSFNGELMVDLSLLVNAKFSLQFQIDGLNYSLNSNYLINRVGSRCVLLVRPFTLETDELNPTPGAFCQAMCENAICEALVQEEVKFLVLGLPFLHRHCLHYSSRSSTSRVSIGRQKNTIDRVCAYSEYVIPPFKVPPGVPFAVPTTTTVSSQNGLSRF